VISWRPTNIRLSNGPGGREVSGGVMPPAEWFRAPANLLLAAGQIVHCTYG
jgi:hypothetical protein